MSEQATILVVDDTEANRRLLGDLLGITGYRVLTASSGAEALALIRDQRPDLVLLDVIMPGMSGYDVCRRIRDDVNAAMLPVVMITALDPGEERLKGLEAGADDFLTKPINQPELLARVRSLLRIKSLYEKLDRTDRLLEPGSHHAGVHLDVDQEVAKQIVRISCRRNSARSQDHPDERIALPDPQGISIGLEFLAIPAVADGCMERMPKGPDCGSVRILHPRQRDRRLCG